MTTNPKVKRNCEICDWDKSGVWKHHIIPVMDYGTDSDDNLVYLCQNHHYLADFGTKEEVQFMKYLIWKKTDKKGSMFLGWDRYRIDQAILELCKEDPCWHFYKDDFDWLKRSILWSIKKKAILRGSRSDIYYHWVKGKEIAE